VNAQFERDAAIRHIITTIVVRSSPDDPYTNATNAELLLTEFRDYWRPRPERRDIAQLFTGRSLAGSTIGIAWVGFICSTGFGYSLVEGYCSQCSNFACSTDLSAHELGHNWDALHCGDEGPGLGGARADGLLTLMNGTDAHSGGAEDSVTAKDAANLAAYLASV
ncbi:MAG: hypothetical protein IH897_04965, partial [Planctomycetes bacterium]|nr:hypothetical protein [Planctomycetota bacterium]